MGIYMYASVSSAALPRSRVGRMSYDCACVICHALGNIDTRHTRTHSPVPQCDVTWNNSVCITSLPEAFYLFIKLINLPLFCYC